MATKSATNKSSAGTAPKSGKAAGAAARKPRTLAGHVAPANDPERDSLLDRYQAAITLLHAGKFDKAHDAFAALLPKAPPDIAPSVRMYINTCKTEMEKRPAKFSNAEERYDYAISLLNHGHYEDAREHFEDILKGNKNTDYAFYGLALLAAMTSDCPRCIEMLTEAIRLNPQNRLQARLDSDFEPVADDPAFTELLYPEA